MSGSRHLPDARLAGLLSRELDGEVLVYDSERHKAFCLNRAAAIVWKHCDGQTPVPDVTRRLAKELGGGADEEVVWYALSQLGRAGLLRERAAVPPGRAVSRRELLRRLGVAAVVLPAVLTVGVPTALAQASPNCNQTKRPAGCPCNGNGNCQSGTCLSNNTCA